MQRLTRTYSEYSVAQEHAMKLRISDAKNIRIDPDGGSFVLSWTTPSSTTTQDETTGDRKTLTPEQLDAVKAYARDYGTTWKDSLRSDWMRSGSKWIGPYHLLQQIRNQHGPRWLVDFKLSPETDGQILGWSRGINKYGDQTGIAHLIIDKDGIGVCACGSKGRTSGQVEIFRPGGNTVVAMSVRPCKRCERYDEKHAATAQTDSQTASSDSQTSLHTCNVTDDDGRAVAPDRVTCGNCGNSWCERCDPAPSAQCHTCTGRGYSTAPLGKA